MSNWASIHQRVGPQFGQPSDLAPGTWWRGRLGSPTGSEITAPLNPRLVEIPISPSLAGWPGVASFRPLASPMYRLRRPLVQRHRPLARPRSANPAASGRETTAAVSRMPGKLCRSDLPRAVRLYPPKLSYMTGRRWFPGIPCVGKEFASARTSNLIMTGGDPTVHTAHLFTNGGACCGAVSAPVYGFFSPLKKLVLGTMPRMFGQTKWEL